MEWFAATSKKIGRVVRTTIQNIADENSLGVEVDPRVADAMDAAYARAQTIADNELYLEAVANPRALPVEERPEPAWNKFTTQLLVRNVRAKYSRDKRLREKSRRQMRVILADGTLGHADASELDDTGEDGTDSGDSDGADDGVAMSGQSPCPDSRHATVYIPPSDTFSHTPPSAATLYDDAMRTVMNTRSAQQEREIEFTKATDPTLTALDGASFDATDASSSPQPPPPPPPTFGRRVEIQWDRVVDVLDDELTTHINEFLGPKTPTYGFKSRLDKLSLCTQIAMLCSTLWILLLAFLFIMFVAVETQMVIAAHFDANTNRTVSFGDITPKTHWKRHVDPTTETTATSTRTLAEWIAANPTRTDADADANTTPMRGQCCHMLDFTENSIGERIFESAVHYNRWEHASLRVYKMDTYDMDHLDARRTLLINSGHGSLPDALKLPLGPAGILLQLDPSGAYAYYALESRWTSCVYKTVLAVHEARFEALAQLLGMPILQVDIQYTNTFEDQRYWRTGHTTFATYRPPAPQAQTRNAGDIVDVGDIGDPSYVRVIQPTRIVPTRTEANADNIRNSYIPENSHEHVAAFTWSHDADAVCDYRAPLWQGSDGNLAILRIRINPELRHNLDSIGDEFDSIKTFAHTVFNRNDAQSDSYLIHVDLANIHACFFDHEIYHDIETEGDAPYFCVDSDYVASRVKTV